jgi:hypothetical protein
MDELFEKDSSFPALQVTPKTGDENFIASGDRLNLKLLDFWKWSVSDLVSNATRGILAEFIVASALGCSGGVRNEWDAFDILFDGTKIEVKSAAYLQSWAHAKLSNITFTIRPTIAWNSQTNKFDLGARRQADVYIFCLLKHQNKETIDPMNLDQWKFYVLSAKLLDEKLPTQKTISLARLLKLKPIVARYEDLADCLKNWQLKFY